GVLRECLLDPAVERVLVINRKPGGKSHPKLTEVIHTDFTNLSAIESQLRDYTTCFFCLGISSVGVTDDYYVRTTYDLTLSFAQIMARLNPDMTFCYVSGAGTDSTERGRIRWARVKGKTENDLLKLPFRSAYMFRPGFLKPTSDLKNVKSYYRFINWLFPVIKAVYPNGGSTLAELGRAMIHVAERGYDKPVLEVPDIIKLAD
ncbi:MAG: epimerase, partial [Cytophagaceae bacterium]